VVHEKRAGCTQRIYLPTQTLFLSSWIIIIVEGMSKRKRVEKEENKEKGTRMCMMTKCV
jgi:hypothetical protein